MLKLGEMAVEHTVSVLETVEAMGEEAVRPGSAKNETAADHGLTMTTASSAVTPSPALPTRRGLTSRLTIAG